MKTVVLLSGGLDSAVVLAHELELGREVHALTVDYGQRHVREIASARLIAHYYGVSHTVITVDPVLFEGSALTGDSAVPAGAATEPDSTYVPARNTVLLALGAARAEAIGAGSVAFGANADDADAYPDCRRKYVEALRDVLCEGTVGHVWLTAPLIGASKKAVIAEAERLNVPVELTWSCYQGGDKPCGVCGACATRGTA